MEELSGACQCCYFEVPVPGDLWSLFFWKVWYHQWTCFYPSAKVRCLFIVKLMRDTLPRTLQKELCLHVLRYALSVSEALAIIRTVAGKRPAELVLDRKVWNTHCLNIGGWPRLSMEDDDASMDASKFPKRPAHVSWLELNRPWKLESGRNLKSNWIAKAGLG